MQYLEELTKCNTCPTLAPEEQMTQIDGFSGKFVCEWCWVNSEPEEAN
jgi:hypothetical protein